MSIPTAPGPKDYALLVLLASIWGASFLFIKIAVADIPPLTITAGRISLAALILYIAMKLAGQNRPTGTRNWLLITGAALFGNALPFTLISWGELKVDSGLAAILMAIMPLSTLILAHFFTNDEKLTKRKILGIIVGFAGIIILIGPAVLKSLGSEALAQLAVAAGAICYSIASMFIKHLHGVPGRAAAAWVMLISTVMVLPACLFFDQPWQLAPDPTSVIAVVILGIFPTALAMLFVLKIIREQGASFLSMNNYMVPIFGVIWGTVFLAEHPSPQSGIALVLILAGIAISRAKLQSKERAPNAAPHI